MGNVVNRVFDSSGPEGKVRGTPQQIIDKYLVHARDAQLSGDRVAAENFLQHAEHYLRMLNEAMAEQSREAEQRREQQQTQQQNQQQSNQQQYNQPRRGDESDGDGGDTNEPRQDTRSDRPDWKDRRNVRRNPRRDAEPRDDAKPRTDERQSDDRQTGERQNGERQSGERQTNERQPEPSRSHEGAQESNLVETPESKAADPDKRPARAPRQPRPRPEAAEPAVTQDVAQATPAPTETPAADGGEKPKRARKPRVARAKDDGATDQATAETSAAPTPD